MVTLLILGIVLSSIVTIVPAVGLVALCLDWITGCTSNEAHEALIIFFWFIAQVISIVAMSMALSLT